MINLTRQQARDILMPQLVELARGFSERRWADEVPSAVKLRAEAILDALGFDDEQTDLRLHIGDSVEHRTTRMIGKVTGFWHHGTTDVMIDGAGPYPQMDFFRLVRSEVEDHRCHGGMDGRICEKAWER